LEAESQQTKQFIWRVFYWTLLSLSPGYLRLEHFYDPLATLWYPHSYSMLVLFGNCIKAQLASEKDEKHRKLFFGLIFNLR